MPFKLPKLFNKQVLLGAQAHAELEYPSESVGVIINNKYIPVKNTHKQPTKYFTIKKETIITLKKIGEIQAVIHSHTNGIQFPSFTDIKTQIAWNIPFGILVVNELEEAGSILWFGDSVPKVPLIGRVFMPGIYDCFSILRDYFLEKYNFYLKDCPRDILWYNQNTHNDLYLNNFKKYGWEVVEDCTADDLQVNDVLLINLTRKNNKPTHGAVYLGGDDILHHEPGRISCIGSCSKFINHQRLHSVIRYKDQSVFQINTIKKTKRKKKNGK